MNTAVANAKLQAWEKALFGVPFRESYKLLPGLGLALAVMTGASALADLLGRAVLRLQKIDPSGKASPVSAIMVSILLGMLVANTVGTTKPFAAGLDFSIKKVLRLGIILVGLKLSFLDVVKLSVWGVPVVLLLVAAALVMTVWFARRFGVSDRLGTLAAASTAICGVTATVAVAASIDADDKEVAYTVANVTLFGVLAMLFYPYVAHLLFAGAPGSAGLFLGTAIHDTSQVMGAALSYKEVFGDELAMKVATITKLTRNVFLVGVVPVLAVYFAKKQGGERKRVSVAKLFPIFVLGFLAMAALRSIGDAGAAHGLAFGVLEPGAWSSLSKILGERCSHDALATAMAGVGLTTRLSVFKDLGLKPLYVGALSALLVGGLSLLLSAAIGSHIGG